MNFILKKKKKIVPINSKLLAAIREKIDFLFRKSIYNLLKRVELPS